MKKLFAVIAIGVIIFSCNNAAVKETTNTDSLDAAIPGIEDTTRKKDSLIELKRVEPDTSNTPSLEEALKRAKEKPGTGKDAGKH